MNAVDFTMTRLNTIVTKKRQLGVKISHLQWLSMEADHAETLRFVFKAARLNGTVEHSHVIWSANWDTWFWWETRLPGSCHKRLFQFWKEIYHEVVWHQMQMKCARVTGSISKNADPFALDHTTQKKPCFAHIGIFSNITIDGLQENRTMNPNNPGPT